MRPLEKNVWRSLLEIHGHTQKANHACYDVAFVKEFYTRSGSLPIILRTEQRHDSLSDMTFRLMKMRLRTIRCRLFHSLLTVK